MLCGWVVMKDMDFFLLKLFGLCRVCCCCELGDWVYIYLGGGNYVGVGWMVKWLLSLDGLGY